MDGSGVPPVPRRSEMLCLVESPALKDGANQLPPLPGRLWQCVGFLGETGAMGTVGAV